jgi:exopolysaccharide/PEP-CTERM locus tyrosine autokinase
MTKIDKAIGKLQSGDARYRRKRQAEPAGSSEESLLLPSIGALQDGEELLTADLQSSLSRVSIDFSKLCEQGLFPPVDQQREVADQYRIIKRPLLDNASGTGAYLAPDANLIMVTSALPGDGKTFTCLNLALSMANEKDKSVLLVDADVVKPHISTLFDLHERPGLVDLLINRDLNIKQTVVPTSVNNLWLLPAGREEANAAELLASRRMETVVKALSEQGSNWIILFDSPPILATSEARVLARSMGQIVLVVRAGKTPQDAVIDAASSFDISKPVSVVLNGLSRAAGHEYYGYGSRGRTAGQDRSEQQ